MELGRSGRPMLTSASPGRGGGDGDGAGRAQRGTGSSTTDRKICSTNRGRRLSSRAQRCGRRTERSSERSSEFGGVDRVRCPLARAKGWAARCRPSCSTCSGRLGGAAAAGRTMVRSPAAPSPFRFSGLLFADSDSGGPMLTSASPGRGGGDHDGACRAQRGTGSSTTDRKICSTNRGRRLPSRAQRCGRRTERSSE